MSKVIIEAEIVCGAIQNCVRCSGEILARWYPDTKPPNWVAEVNRRWRDDFPDEPSARRWVLEQLGAKEVAS